MVASEGVRALRLTMCSSVRRFGMGRLAKFPTRFFRPRQGTIGGLIFENPNIGMARTLFHEVHIPLAPFKLEGETVRTELRLDFMVLPIRALSELDEKTFEFPPNPEDGYVDGSIYLLGAHVPIDVPRISFTRRRSATIHATVTLDLHFQSERTGYKNVRTSMATRLRFVGIRIDRDMVRPASAKTARKVLSRFADTQQFQDPTRDGAHYVFAPRA
jgi:hypothetical protein